jgi:hypothetical protein
MPDKPAESGGPAKNGALLSGIGVKRPLVPVVLALMVGLVAAAWGFKIPGGWLLVGLAGLLAVLALLRGRGSGQSSKDQGREASDKPTDPG